MCSISRDNKCTHIYSSTESILLSSAHNMTLISLLWLIINLCTPCAPLVASINTICLCVLLLTFRTRHFPLSCEGVHGPGIGVHQWTQGTIDGILKVFRGWSGEAHIMFSSSAWFHPPSTLYRHNKNRYSQSEFWNLCASFKRLLLWILVWYFFPNMFWLAGMYAFMCFSILAGSKTCWERNSHWSHTEIHRRSRLNNFHKLQKSD
jgi:hypothetical protein